MLLTACLSLFSWADYRIDRLSSGVLSQRQILAMSVSGSASPAFNVNGTQKIQPAPTVVAFAGPMIPAEILEERNRIETAAPVQIAMASFIDPPETLFIEKLRRRSNPPSSEFSMRLSVEEADEVVAPTRSSARRDVNGEAIAAALPEIISVDAATDVAGTTTETSECAEVGPVASADAPFTEDLRAALPFDPLAVGPFLPAASSARPEPSANPFHDFLAELVHEDVEAIAYTHELKHSIRQGETMTEVLSNLGLDRGEIDQWIAAAGREHNLNRIYEGQSLSLAMRMPQKELRGLKLELAGEQMLVAELGDDGNVTARREEIVYERGLRVVGSEIEHSLYMTAQANGIPDKIVSDIAEILGWEVNFSNVYEGATFRVVYEEMTRADTAQTIPGRVLAVSLVNRGKLHEGYYFRMPDGSHAGYYNRTGDGLGRAFLRYPVDYSRISSHFTTKRFHPVLKRNVPHYGVDFAAPTGTPVRAVADGKVLKAGWYGGNGRFVKIRHDSVYETGYAHLSRIESGLKPGSEVRKGDVIGYVGATGMATGPHLHFAMYRNTKYIDPLKAELPRERALDGTTLAAFRITVDMMDGAYAKAGYADPEMTRIATAAVEVSDSSEIAD